MRRNLALPFKSITIFSILLISSTLPFIIDNHIEKEKIYQKYQKEKLKHTKLKLKDNLIQFHEIPYDTSLIPIKALDLVNHRIKKGTINFNHIRKAYSPAIRRKYGNVANFFVIYSPYNNKPYWLITPIVLSFSPWNILENIAMLWMIFFILITKFSFLFNSAIFRRINSIEQAAESIIRGNISERLSEKFHTKTPYDSILKTINLMLDKMENLIVENKQVNSHIAHDLRKPLNRLKNRLEVSLLNKRTTEQYESTLSETIEDIDELTQIFNNLLLMGNLNSGASTYHFESICIKTIINNLYNYYTILTEEKFQKFTINLPETSICIHGNKSLISQALSNLIDNAIKYTPEHGKINIRLTKENSVAKLVIIDNGIGIPSEDHTSVFNKFYRVDEARTKEGSGLGLSLVKTVLEKHNAMITLSNNKPKGTKITVYMKIYE